MKREADGGLGKKTVLDHPDSPTHKTNPRPSPASSPILGLAEAVASLVESVSRCSCGEWPWFRGLWLDAILPETYLEFKDEYVPLWLKREIVTSLEARAQTATVPG